MIEHSTIPSKVKPSKIASLYLHDGLSAQQIANKTGLCKASVLARLHSLDIRSGRKNQPLTDPKNYKATVTPYGFKKVNNQLVPCQREIKICRLIVSLVNNEKLSYRATARKLEEKNIKNRKGKVSWGNCSISSIYKRWNVRL